jgi:hypothetical protein
MIDLDTALAALGLEPDEATSLLDVSDRTLRRWREDGVPATAEAALRAWLTLHEWGIPWRPDTVSVIEDDRHQIRRAREHAVDVDAMLKRVKARGGPRDPWTVDFGKRQAFFDTYRVGFYKLANGGFSLSTYTRRGEPPDAKRDAERIEDAAFWIADAYRRNADKTKALHAIAANTRKNSRFYVRDGARMHTPDERAEHIATIKTIADKLDALADHLGETRTPRADYQALLDQLHNVGFFPDGALVSEAARAFHREE